MKKSLIFLRIFAVLLSLTMLTAAFGSSLSAEETEPAPARDLSKYLVLHYDFEGDSIQKKLADKAGTVNTQLSVITACPGVGDGLFPLKDDGSLPEEIKADDAFINNVFTLDNGIIECKKAEIAAVSSGSTQDLLDLQKERSEFTWYLRAKVLNFSYLTVMRWNPADKNNTRAFYMHVVDGDQIVYSANDGATSTTESIGADDEGWFDIVITRSYVEGDQKPYQLNLYAYKNGAWTQINNNGVRDKVTALHSAEDVILSFFNGFTNGYPTTEKLQYGAAYDDIKCYNTVLTLEEMEAARVEPAPTTPPAQGENTEDAGNDGAPSTPTIPDNKPAKTDAPAKTEAPTGTEAPATDAPAAEEGCASMIFGAALLPALLVPVALMIKKKEEK